MFGLANKTSEKDNAKTSKLELIKDHFSKMAEKDLDDEIASDDKGASIFLIVVNGLWFMVDG